MNNLTKLYNTNILDNSENSYLYFNLGDSKYALKIQQVVEIMKLPALDYPQKLANKVIGLLKYNNFTINILDLRFYLNIKVMPYSTSNQLLIVKTDENFFGLIIDKVEDIVYVDQWNMEYFTSSGEAKIIEAIYQEGTKSISVINLNNLENILKEGVVQSDVDIPSLFPQDDDSKYEFMQRNLMLQEKSATDLITNVFSQDKFSTFLINDNFYCINLEYVKEFFKNVPITKVPCNLDYIEGVVAIRGDFITIINLKKFLGEQQNETLQKADESKDLGKNQIIIIECFDYKIGMLVDEILEITNISEELIKQNYVNQNKYLLSEVLIEDKFYTILNIKNILSDEKFFIEEN